MKSTKAFIATALALVMLVSLTACTSRNDNTSSSSVAPSSAPAASSMAPSSSEPDDLLSDIEDGVSDVASNIESAVTTTMSTDFDKIGALGGSQIKWGPGVQVDEANRTIAPIGLQEQYGEYSAWFIAPDDCGKFYLTFDEGYENGYTEEILDVLKEKNCSAVFFVTLPYVQSCPELVQRMIDEGHVVGNHTSHHWNPTSKSIDDAAEDIRELHNYVLENFGYEMTLRPKAPSANRRSRWRRALAIRLVCGVLLIRIMTPTISVAMTRRSPIRKSLSMKERFIYCMQSAVTMLLSLEN